MFVFPIERFKESSGIATWRLQFPIDLHSYNVMSVKVKLSKDVMVKLLFYVFVQTSAPSHNYLKLLM